MNRHVLVVDDSLTVRMDLNEAFSAIGLQTVLCENLATARAEITRTLPAVIVLDIQLPDGDGIDFLAELRRGAPTADLPVLLLSSESEVRDRVRGLKTGANEYVGKPYDATHVVARAVRLIRDSHPAAEQLTILVIDDSLTFRNELSEQLTAAGYRVATAASGEEGLRRVSDLRPDAVIVDGVMPGLDGTAVVRRIRLDPGLHSTPCLLLTASEGVATEVQALDAGADAYVRKDGGSPVVQVRLAAMLRAARDTRRDHKDSPTLLSPKRILAVDDSRTYLEELTERLRADGYEVVQAQSGEEALELLAVENFDCILLDLMMPGLSGTETCRRVKTSSLVRNTPLIMLTAVEEPDAMIDGIDAGADDFVSKSADFELLGARLRAQLRRRQFEDENRRFRETIMRTEAEARRARETAETRAELLGRLEEKNAELQAVNKELQAFAYSVSHDLRQPLRSMDGFSKVLLDRYGNQLDAQGRHYLERIRAGAQRMGDLIDGLLTLTRVTRRELRVEPLRLEPIARRVYQRLLDADPERPVQFSVDVPQPAPGDAQLIESVFENLLGNAWKFTRERTPAVIAVGVVDAGGAPAYFVRDNGIGFNMTYADKLFLPFQRLHAERDYTGNGIGLATVQRIIHRHGGKIWAKGELGAGATFYFTLGQPVAEGTS